MWRLNDIFHYAGSEKYSSASLAGSAHFWVKTDDYPPGDMFVLLGRTGDKINLSILPRAEEGGGARNKDVSLTKVEFINYFKDSALIRTL